MTSTFVFSLMVVIFLYRTFIGSLGEFFQFLTLSFEVSPVDLRKWLVVKTV